MKIVTLPLSAIELNSGQIEGLPANPRQWTLTDVEKLAASLAETPELLEIRCPIVVEQGEKFITLGGNLRVAAARHNKMVGLPCFVLENATIAKMKEIVIKDNGSFGKWDFDSLANEWDSEPLTDWGVDVWEPTQLSDEDIDSMLLDAEDGIKKNEIRIEVFIPDTQIDNRGNIVEQIKEIVKDYGGRVI